MKAACLQYRCWSVVIALAMLCAVWVVFAGWQPALAQEEEPRLFIVGPMGLTRGQTSRHIFFLPAVQRAEEAACHLMLLDTQDNLLVDTEFVVAAGRSITADLTVLADGSVRFNGRPIKAMVGRGELLEIIPCIFVSKLPLGATLQASAQCANNIRISTPPEPVDERPGQTTYILPYVEAVPAASRLPATR